MTQYGQWRAPLLLPLAPGRGLRILRLLTMVPGLLCLMMFLAGAEYFLAAAVLVLIVTGLAEIYALTMVQGQLMLDANDGLWLLDADGSRHKAVPSGPAWLSPWLTVLPFVVAGRNRWLVLLPASVDSNTARLLRTRLRWRKPV